MVKIKKNQHQQTLFSIQSYVNPNYPL